MFIESGRGRGYDAAVAERPVRYTVSCQLPVARRACSMGQRSIDHVTGDDALGYKCFNPGKVRDTGRSANCDAPFTDIHLHLDLDHASLDQLLSSLRWNHDTVSQFRCTTQVS